ncbi:hypothetical protein DWW36_17530 [Erysipelotrichaceae bacterium AF15-26LB]|nr:hypothetical protein [[Clostridium] innocuum]RJV83953.1 hypothetical protein DWW36_17530 [Erysipelotrichaceae bacterium AF15-26LB]RJV88072.1 hypothetical protein DWX45_12680 [Erysipelotrichaceae bacterium AF19-24AC]
MINMLKSIIMCLVILCFVACTSTDKFTQKESCLLLEVNLSKEDADKQIIDNILLNDNTLNDEDKNSIKLVYDEKNLNSLHTFEIIVNKNDTEILKMNIKMQDTTKPKIEISKKEIPYGSDVKDFIKVSDNYDDEEILLKALEIEGYNAKESGKQNIRIKLKDRALNIAELKVGIIVKDEDNESDNSTLNSTQKLQSNSSTYNSGNGASAGSGSSGSTTTGSGYFDANGNPISKEQYEQLINAANKPSEPEYACPTVPHHIEGNVEIWEGDPNFPCDYIFMGSIGNGGLYNTYNEAEAALMKLGLTAQNNPVGSVHYNDGTIKYTFSY